MRVSHPDAKALVFSQFLPALLNLKQSLTREGFAWNTITGDMNANRRAREVNMCHQRVFEPAAHFQWNF